MTDNYTLDQSDDYTDMNEDEHQYIPEFLPVEEEYFDVLDDQHSVASEESQEFIKTNKRNKNKKKKNKKDQKDPTGYRKIKDGKSELEYFSTVPSTGAKIRDPIYGRLYDYHSVGSRDEDLYYKVVYISNGTKEPEHLFYDNPEQFESHMNCQVNTKNKQIWTDKYQLALKRLENTY
jgi:hypothetical protein